ncbi:AraC family transcriptional regulator [Paraburkholderia rhizosphaerae]|nr:AraC family transcriptional regulator [Paraburkholderia rhizosphaerae]
MPKADQSSHSRVACSSAVALSGRAGQIFITHVELGGEGSGDTVEASERRSERYLRLEIVRRGRMTIEQNGEALSFGAGDMLLLDPSFEFSRSLRESAHVSVLHISKQALNDRGVGYRFSRACYPVHETEDVAAIRALLLTFTRYIDNTSDALLIRLGSHFLDLMDVMIENSGALDSGRSTRTIVLRATRLITSHLADVDLSIASIAKELSVSVSSLTRAFRQRGLSPMRYAYDLRLEHAGRLLAETPTLAIQDVASRCGFASPAHFSRLFKAKHGMTPREYTSRHGASEERAAAGREEAEKADEVDEPNEA